jgi:prolipoprotein diacylglyceryltransferase
MVLLLFDSNYHSGYSVVGGLIMGLITAVLVFRTILRKLR